MKSWTPPYLQGFNDALERAASIVAEQSYPARQGTGTAVNQVIERILALRSIQEVNTPNLNGKLDCSGVVMPESSGKGGLNGKEQPDANVDARMVPGELVPDRSTQRSLPTDKSPCGSSDGIGGEVISRTQTDNRAASLLLDTLTELDDTSDKLAAINAAFDAVKRATVDKQAPADKQAAELERHKAYLANLEHLVRNYQKLAEDNWSRYRNLLAWLPQDQRKEALAVVDTFCPPGGPLPQGSSDVSRPDSKQTK